MRVFIAVDFPSQVKEQLEQTIQRLQQETIRGNFTRRENLHLTLAFLGEVSSERIADILNIMNQVAIGVPPIPVEVGGFGKFVNHGESLYWSRISKNKALVTLQKRLVTKLKQQGFFVDLKPFKPHITLSRRCVVKPEFDELAFLDTIDAINMEISAIDLMLSERKDGKVVYSSLGKVTLQE